MYILKTVFIWSFCQIAVITLAQEAGERKLEPFRNIVVGDNIIVQLFKSDQESASVKVQGIDTSAVKTVVKKGTLTCSIFGEPFTRKKVMIKLNYVNLHSIAVNGGAEVSTETMLKSDSLFVDLKSGGTLYLDADVEYLSARIIEGSLLTAEGYATKQDIVVSTAATLSAFDLESETVIVKASTGAKAKVNVENSLDAEASTKAFISYKGNPASINREANSGGSIVVSEP
jgi:hypothetical protein